MTHPAYPSKEGSLPWSLVSRREPLYCSLTHIVENIVSLLNIKII